MRDMKVTEFSAKESRKNMESFRRENSFWKEISLFDLDSIKSGGKAVDVVNCRFYGGGSVVYCVVWCHLWHYEKASARGMGKAGGYGYHKPSAAMSEALSDAGWQFSEGIEARGDTAMTEALQAIADHLGITQSHIHHSHP